MIKILNNKGFGLIPMLVALAVFGIVIVNGLPFLTGLMQNAQLNNTINIANSLIKAETQYQLISLNNNPSLNNYFGNIQQLQSADILPDNLQNISSNSIWTTVGNNKISMTLEPDGDGVFDLITTNIPPDEANMFKAKIYNGQSGYSNGTLTTPVNINMLLQQQILQQQNSTLANVNSQQASLNSQISNFQTQQENLLNNIQNAQAELSNYRQEQTQALNPTSSPTIPSTPTPTPTPTPNPSLNPAPSPTLSSSPNPTPSSTPSPSPTPVTQQSAQQQEPMLTVEQRLPYSDAASHGIKYVVKITAPNGTNTYAILSPPNRINVRAGEVLSYSEYSKFLE